MIEINLLPRAGKKSGRRLGGPGLGSFASLANRVRDPFLAGAVAALVLGGAGVAALHMRLSSRTADLAVREQQAVQDSTRFAAILKEKRAAQAQRDSILRQVAIIRSIDNDRYVWSHIMEEVSRALPAYTWLTSLNQTSSVVSAAAAHPDSVDADGLPIEETPAARAAADSLGPPPLTFRLVGQTVDIQAMTRFMKLLEASPFIQNVQIVRTDVAAADGKQVTEFQLDAQYENPAPSAIRLVPVTLSVR
jgi:Tfp pilus assembly protein PilN